MKIKSVQYNTLRVRGLAGNPLAEALPKRLDEEGFWDAIAAEEIVPYDIDEFSDQEKELQAILLMRSVSPTSLFYEVYKDLCNILMMGYIDRNPMDAETQKVQHLVATGGYKPKKTTSDSIIFTGLSGMGKSTLVDAVLSTIDMVIPHRPCETYDLNFDQIVYIKCNIPGSADIKEICLMALAEIDKVTGENFSEEYRRKGKTATVCVDRLVTLCSTLCIGMLIFDEIQNISLTNSNGQKQVFAFFDKLSNEAKIPVIKIGTSKASRLFQKEFTNVRRLGIPVELTNYAADDDDWNLLLDYAWDYQLVSNPLPLTGELEQLLYQLTQGIPYCLFFLVSQSNIYAIRNQKDSIDAAVLKEVYNLSFKLMRPALSALRLGKTDAFDDLMSVGEGLSNDHKKIVKKLFKIANDYKLQGEAAKEVLDTVNQYLPEYEPTKTEALVLKRLISTVEIRGSEIGGSDNELELPL